ELRELLQDQAEVARIMGVASELIETAWRNRLYGPALLLNKDMGGATLQEGVSVEGLSKDPETSGDIARSDLMSAWEMGWDACLLLPVLACWDKIKWASEDECRKAQAHIAD